MATNPLMLIEVPTAGADKIQPFTLSGWALDLGAGAGTGVDIVAVTAYPRVGAGTSIGNATYGAARADIGAIYGAQWTNCGWTITITGLPLGVYTLVASAHSTVTGTYNDTVNLVANVTIARPSPPTITAAASRWLLHRCDTKPRGEQTA